MELTKQTCGTQMSRSPFWGCLSSNGLSPSIIQPSTCTRACQIQPLAFLVASLAVWHLRAPHQTAEALLPVTNTTLGVGITADEDNDPTLVKASKRLALDRSLTSTSHEIKLGCCDPWFLSPFQPRTHYPPTMCFDLFW